MQYKLPTSDPIVNQNYVEGVVIIDPATGNPSGGTGSNQPFPALTGTGSAVLPTANGTFLTADMSSNQSKNCQVYIEFFSDLACTIPASPTAGTIAVSGTPMGNNYLAPSTGATVNATDCATPNSNYTPPLFTGKMVNGKAVLNGIVGAPYCKITFWRYG